MSKKISRQGNENQNPSNPRTESKATDTLDAAPSFTPAPWKAVQHSPLDAIYTSFCVHTEGNGNPETVVATLNANNCWGIPVEANARLIAAAPTMYELLRETQAYIETQENETMPDEMAALWNRIAAALALVTTQEPNSAVSAGTTDQGVLEMKMSNQKINQQGNENNPSSGESSGSLKTSELDAGPSFTPGPWQVIREDADGRTDVINVITDEADPWYICEVTKSCDEHDLPDHEAESLANARLIAASPLLYHALESTLQILAEYSDDEALVIQAGAIRNALALAITQEPASASALSTK